MSTTETPPFCPPFLSRIQAFHISDGLRCPIFKTLKVITCTRHLSYVGYLTVLRADTQRGCPASHRRGCAHRGSELPCSGPQDAHPAADPRAQGHGQTVSTARPPDR